MSRTTSTKASFIAGNIKFEVEKFNGKTNFTLWQRRVKNILIQQGLKMTLLGKTNKPTTMNDDDWTNHDENAVSTIQNSF